MMRLAMATAILIGTLVVGPTAQAQGASAYQAGLYWAQRRGAPTQTATPASSHDMR